MLAVTNFLTNSRGKLYSLNQHLSAPSVGVQSLTVDKFQRQTSFSGKSDDIFEKEVQKANPNYSKLMKVIKEPDFDPNRLINYKQMFEQKFSEGTPLFYFVAKRKPQFIAELIKNPKTDPNIIMPGDWQYNALHYAIKIRAKECTEELLKSDKINLLAKTFNHGYPAQIAFNNGDYDIAELINSRIPTIDLLKLEMKNTDNSEFNSNLLKIFKRNDFSPNVFLDENQHRTLLMACVEQGRVEATKQLLSHPQINQEIKNAKGITAKHLATECGNTAVSELFGFKTHLQNDFTHEMNKDVLDIPEILQILRSPGFNPNFKFKLFSSNYPKISTPLREVIERNQSELLIELLKNEYINPNIIVNSADNQTLLMKCIQNGWANSAEKLLNHPMIDQTITNVTGDTAKDLAIMGNNPAILKLFGLKVDFTAKLLRELESKVLNESKILEIFRDPDFDPNIIVSKKDNQTLLMKCIEKDLPGITEMLLSHPNIDQTITNITGETAKDLAIMGNNPAILKLFGLKVDLTLNLLRELESKVLNESKILEIFHNPDFDPNARFHSKHKDSFNGDTVLFKLVRMNLPDLISELLKNEKTDPNLLSLHGFKCTPLIEAVTHNKFECVKALLESKKIDLSIQVDGGSTVKDFANEPNRSSMLKMITDYEKMIKGHANLNVKLQEMSNNADFDMGKLREIIMSQHFDSSVVDSNKNTPLHIATRSTSPESLELMLLAIERGNSVNAQNSKQITPLINAVITKNLQKVKLLLDKGAHINTCDNIGQAPIHYAAVSKDENLIKLLLNYLPDLNLKTQTQKTVFDFVKDNVKLTELFKQHFGRL